MNMKTKFLALAAFAGLAVTSYYLLFKRGKKGTRAHENIKKQTALAEKHIRGVMNKSKLAF
jgi:hypothetical protein